MTRPAAAALAALLTLAALGTLGAHELYLKLNSYLLPTSAARVRVPVLNGTFTASEGGVARDRVAAIAVVGPAGRRAVGADAWEAVGDSSFVTVPLGAPGTYLVGAATRPRIITLPPAAFAEYLREEGLEQVVSARPPAGESERPARERYAKHVKAVFQKGAPRTPGFEAVLGHPAELVPLANPYSLGVGDTLDVRTLLGGRAAPNEVVIAGGTLPSGRAIAARRLRADAAGLVRVPLVAPGRWYVRFIHIERLRADSAADYESRWATLTFAVR